MLQLIRCIEMNVVAFWWREFAQKPRKRSVEFACSPRVGVGCLQVPQFPPTAQKLAHQVDLRV